MGILTDSNTRNSLMQLIQKKGILLTTLLFTGGLLWFAALMHPEYNGHTYFSENALLPGLVRAEYRGQMLDSFYNGHKAAQKKVKSDSDVPIEWLKEELNAIGLEVYVQDYTFTYPMNLMNNRTVEGRNVYAYLRAPRSSSTEAMAIITLLRPSGSGLSETSGSVALMLSLAKQFKSRTYWSKDIILIFAQHEYIGVQAWLDGYLGVKTSEYIEPGRIEARGGVIQAAIGLEFDGLSFKSLDVLTEGINGILPNLDLVNVANRLSKESGIAPTIHGRRDFASYNDLQLVKHNLQTAFLMMSHQASGMASGSHGLFLRYRIDAITIKGVSGKGHSLWSAGKVIEGVIRSVNNLIEKFHQSFFFYILPDTSRYISIGVYMIPFGLLVASGLIQTLRLWGKFSNDVTGRDANLKANKDKAFTADGKLSDQTLSTLRLPDSVLQGMYMLLPVFIGCHVAGLMLNKCPDFFGTGEIKQLPAVQAVLLGSLSCIVSMILIFRSVMRKEEFDGLNWRLLKAMALIYYGLVLFSLSLFNISLATITAVISLPVYCIIGPVSSRIATALQALLLLLVSPLGIFLIAYVLYSHISGEAAFNTWTPETLLTSVHDSIIYGLIDHLVFNNHLYNVISLVLYPIWLMFWSLIWMNQ